MRSLFVAASLLVFAAHVNAQSARASNTTAPAKTNATTNASTDDTTTATTDDTAPALIKTVVDDPNDSPMVRAAKRAVASRLRNPNQRRVVSLTTTSATTRGRFAVSTGPVEGPKLPPVPSDAKPVKTPTVQSSAAVQKAQVQEKLKKLEVEQSMMAAETDEPYGGDLEEDQVDQRMAAIEAERKKLQQTTAPTPPPPPPPKR